jgi:hypothetical protein
MHWISSRCARVTAHMHDGESSKDEMCLAGMGRFPSGGKTVCAKGGGLSCA